MILNTLQKRARTALNKAGAQNDAAVLQLIANEQLDAIDGIGRAMAAEIRNAYASVTVEADVTQPARSTTAAGWVVESRTYRPSRRKRAAPAPTESTKTSKRKATASATKPTKKR